MRLQDLVNKDIFEILNLGEDLEQEVTKPFCCDLLSIAMSKAPVGGVWVTVMGNVNTLAVAALTDISCIILAEGATLDIPAMGKAKLEKVTVLKTELPIFEAALAVYNEINA